jgi:hypothetical protein
MIGWGEVAVTMEQHRDRLRRAEKSRLIEQVSQDQPHSGWWQSVRNRFSAATERDQTRLNHGQLANKSA